MTRSHNTEGSVKGRRGGAKPARDGIAFATPKFEWQLDAACARPGAKHVDLAFSPVPADRARFIAHNCKTCPVVAECAAFADEFKVTHGVWGGHTLGAGQPEAIPDGDVA